MANRSYLYASDTLPTSNGTKPENMIGVCEFNYDYSYSTLILVGAKPVGIFPSVLWDNSLLIAAEFDTGTELFKKFLEKAQQLKVDDNEFLKINTERAISYLTTNKRKYFLLEFSELMAMSSSMEDEKEIQKYAEDLVEDAEECAKIEVPNLLKSDIWTPSFEDIQKNIRESKLDLAFNPHLYFDVCSETP